MGTYRLSTSPREDSVVNPRMHLHSPDCIMDSPPRMSTPEPWNGGHARSAMPWPGNTCRGPNGQGHELPRTEAERRRYLASLAPSHARNHRCSERTILRLCTMGDCHSPLSLQLPSRQQFQNTGEPLSNEIETIRSVANSQAERASGAHKEFSGCSLSPARASSRPAPIRRATGRPGPLDEVPHLFLDFGQGDIILISTWNTCSVDILTIGGLPQFPRRRFAIFA